MINEVQTDIWDKYTRFRLDSEHFVRHFLLTFSLFIMVLKYLSPSPEQCIQYFLECDDTLFVPLCVCGWCMFYGIWKVIFHMHLQFNRATARFYDDITLIGSLTDGTEIKQSFPWGTDVRTIKEWIEEHYGYDSSRIALFDVEQTTSAPMLDTHRLKRDLNGSIMICANQYKWQVSKRRLKYGNHFGVKVEGKRFTRVEHKTTNDNDYTEPDIYLTVQSENEIQSLGCVQVIEFRCHGESTDSYFKIGLYSSDSRHSHRFTQLDSGDTIKMLYDPELGDLTWFKNGQCVAHSNTSGSSWKVSWKVEIGSVGDYVEIVE